MKLVQSLAADYWIENTNRIYREDLHVSTPVMEAYEAGFRKATELAAKRADDRNERMWGETDRIVKQIGEIPDKDDGFGPSLHDQVMAEDFFVYDELGYLGRFFRWVFRLCVRSKGCH